ncbi:hypothetical protein PHLGIDRAFT_359635 [Phlebiopsis gigantea 11061_1 CR5-6]|uniref:Uncharacterized protein n=1 Tax=Phlebiopsis gigantea (strain 11061_1 CR5-6) TaxID=745531 RepID=A0A0C3S1M1_PHLG1|nr:hypothetical protein PHLGIDRAFT_359635 [Phlebiopsis gigantea 11061_1 CR5-6]
MRPGGHRPLPRGPSKRLAMRSRCRKLLQSDKLCGTHLQRSRSGILWRLSSPQDTRPLSRGVFMLTLIAQVVNRSSLPTSDALRVQHDATHPPDPLPVPSSTSRDARTASPSSRTRSRRACAPPPEASRRCPKRGGSFGHRLQAGGRGCLRMMLPHRGSPCSRIVYWKIMRQRGNRLRLYADGGREPRSTRVRPQLDGEGRQ